MTTEAPPKASPRTSQPQVSPQAPQPQASPKPSPEPSPEASQPYHHGSLRAALLDAAETILERDGFPALTLRAVARAADVSHAAPAHHFGDLTGLLSDLAATGYVRFCAALLAGMAQAGPGAKDRLHAMGLGYVRFAREHPHLFLLMFRSERLDPLRPALSEAMRAAYDALAAAASASADASPRSAADKSSQDAADASSPNAVAATAPPSRLADITAAWAIAHGLALLLIDGRLRLLADDGSVDALVSESLSRLRL